MLLNQIFEYAVDPNTISVYIGRLIALDEKFEENGLLYVDLTDPDSDDLDSGTKTSVTAQATFAMVQSYSLWQNPQEVLNKAKFDGSLNFTSSGDFHLRNYCFDMQTMAWFTTVSTALNAIGVANVPPVMVSLDTTPFGGQAVAINLSTSVKEAADEAISDGLKDTKMNSSTQAPTSNIPDKKDVESTLLIPDPNQQRSLLRDNNNNKIHYIGVKEEYTGNDPTMKTIYAIIKPIDSILTAVVEPYYTIFECIGILFQIYNNRMTELSEITFPITQFATIKDDGSIEDPKPMETLAIKTQLHERIELIQQTIFDANRALEDARTYIYSDIVDKLYDPINYIYTQISSKLADLTGPIKQKLIWIISDCLKEGLSKFSELISMLIQPVVAALPTVVQMIVKLALKKLLKELIGVLITQTLSGITTQIERAINLLSTNITAFLSDIIATAITSITNPLVSQIQESMASIICYFNATKLRDKLIAIRDNQIEFPPIYIGSNAVRPYKDFDDIDWSNPQELSAMFFALIEEVISENGTVTPDMQFTKKELKEEIYVVNVLTYPYRYIQGYHYKFCDDVPQDKKDLFSITIGQSTFHTMISLYRGATDTGQIEYDNPQQNTMKYEGTIKVENDRAETNPYPHSNLNQDIFYRTFKSKDEFLPYFEALHPPYTKNAVCNYEGNPHPEDVTPYLKNITPSRWLTNNVPYIDVEINGKVGRYICNTYGSTIHIKVRHNDAIITVDLHPSNVCYSTEIDHIPEDSNDFTVGKDLVPLLDKNGNIVPLKIQELGKKNKNGETDVLYHFFELPDECEIIKSNTLLSKDEEIWGSNGYDQNRELNTYTFDELASAYYKKDNTYYAWMTTGLKDSSTPTEVKDIQDKEASNEIITDMLQTAVTDIGLSDGFSADGMMKAIKNKIMGMFDKIADAISQVDSIVDSAMDKTSVDGSGMESIINNLKNTLEDLNSAIKKISDTAEPALVATAKAASSVAMQSCSMTQSAKDKDASFTTNDSYDLSITTEPKSLHPYHNRLKREKFLEPNCKILLLAVGSGTRNLVAVDILS